jgi:transcriptional repressor NrdR
MKCPHCGYQHSKVIDSRSTSAGTRRRRQCLKCGYRFTTYEHVHANGLLVVKKDGRREEFSREKLSSGLRKACAKRPVDEASIEKVVDDIEQKLQRMGKREASTSVIGELVMQHLERLDRVAYVRFASVYRDFADIQTFKKAIDALVQSQETESPPSQLPLIPCEPLDRDALRASR